MVDSTTRRWRAQGLLPQSCRGSLKRRGHTGIPQRRGGFLGVTLERKPAQTTAPCLDITRSSKTLERPRSSQMPIWSWMHGSCAWQRSWLVKAIVPDENAIGVMGIQAGDNVLYLNRVQHKIKRSEEVLQVSRPQSGRNLGPKKLHLTGMPSLSETMINLKKNSQLTNRTRLQIPEPEVVPGKGPLRDQSGNSRPPC